MQTGVHHREQPPDPVAELPVGHGTPGGAGGTRRAAGMDTHAGGHLTRAVDVVDVVVVEDEDVVCCGCGGARGGGLDVVGRESYDLCRVVVVFVNTW